MEVYMRLIFRQAILAATLLVTACGPSTDQISASAKTSIQSTLDTDTALSQFHLSVNNVQVIETGKNQYQGMAEIESSDGSIHNVKIDIVSDGKSIQWEAKPGAFGFVALEAIKKAQDELSESQASTQQPAIYSQDDAQWSVQVASISRKEKADEIIQKIKGEGYSAYLTNKDNMNRIFVGPIQGRTLADRTKEELNSKLGLNGFVVRYNQ